MAKYVVGTLEEIPSGSRKIVEVAGRSVGIFNIDGVLFALRNRCPHQGGPLCLGTLGGVVVSTAPGEYAYSRPSEMLRCPWHGWEFDVRTGQSWFDPRHVRVRRYEVTVEPTAPNAPASDHSGLQPGPYTAETYAVSVEQQVVMIEIP